MVVSVKRKKEIVGRIDFLDFRENLGAETVYGQQVRHSFTRHTHRTLCIGIVEDGVFHFGCRQQQYAIRAGQIFIIPPEEPHACSTEGQEYVNYRSLLVSHELLHLIIGNARIQDCSQVIFKEIVIDDKKLFGKLQKLHAELSSTETQLMKQSLLISTVGYLIEHYGNLKFDFKLDHSHDNHVERARIFIDDHYNECLSLAEIAQRMYLNPFYFLRIFGQSVGVPPHIYQQQVRIRHAKEMLLSDIPIVQVASNTGFVDQSHFTKVFRKIVGVTPGEYKVQ